ncbi:AraC family transcriptional regulator [Shewanella sp. TC10]|uniref:AraC family transcriptional regulator n=1 Tax=Shewanella sp. TC10 TaxID=1419739 RepID=UPI00129EDD68|nr:helix-turn-helix transcriptional regulator [Shewanella sp. TC10]
MVDCHVIPDIEYRSPSLKESGIEIVDLEVFRSRLSAYKFDPYRPHRVSYFCLLFITEGQGRHLIDFNRYDYQSGSVIFINPSQVHAFDSDDCPQGEMINITSSFLSSSSANIRTSYFVPAHISRASFPVITLSQDLKHSCQVLLDEVRKSQLENEADDLVVQLLLSTLLVKLGRARKSHSAHISEHQKERFGHFLSLVELHYVECREALQYANKMHTSYKNLNLLCKSCSGQTAKQLIDFRMILEIKRKLAMDGLSVQQAADELGFDDLTHFNKYFKRKTANTPAAFKRQHERAGI